MFWLCFIPIGIVDIVILPLGETLDRSFFVEIVLDSLKKKFPPNSRSESRKGLFLHLDNARPHVADHEIQAHNLTWLSHPAYSPGLALADFWLLGI
jgi:hypothetical protein